MENRIKNDLRIDKRLRAVFGEIDLGSVTSNPADTREGILAEQETDAAKEGKAVMDLVNNSCLLYTSPSPRDLRKSRMPSSA